MKNTFYKQRNRTIKMYTNKFPEKRSNSVSNNVGRYHQKKSHPSVITGYNIGYNIGYNVGYDIGYNSPGDNGTFVGYQYGSHNLAGDNGVVVGYKTKSKIYPSKNCSHK